MTGKIWRDKRFWKYIIVFVVIIACIVCFDKVFLRTQKYNLPGTSPVFEPHRLVLNSPLKLLLISDDMSHDEAVALLGFPQRPSSRFSGRSSSEWTLSGGIVLSAGADSRYSDFKITGFRFEGLVFPIIVLLVILALVISYKKGPKRRMVLSAPEKKRRIRNIIVAFTVMLVVLILLDQIVLCRLLKNEKGCAPYRLCLPLQNTSNFLSSAHSKEEIIEILGPPSDIQTIDGSTYYYWNMLFGPVVEYRFSESNLKWKHMCDYSFSGWIMPILLVVMIIAAVCYYNKGRCCKYEEQNN